MINEKKNEKKRKLYIANKKKTKQIFIYEKIYNIRQQTTTTKKNIIKKNNLMLTLE